LLPALRQRSKNARNKDSGEPVRVGFGKNMRAEAQADEHNWKAQHRQRDEGGMGEENATRTPTLDTRLPKEQAETL
jgi:hypothetical protein